MHSMKQSTDTSVIMNICIEILSYITELGKLSGKLLKKYHRIRSMDMYGSLRIIAERDEIIVRENLNHLNFYTHNECYIPPPHPYGPTQSKTLGFRS